MDRFPRPQPPGTDAVTTVPLARRLFRPVGGSGLAAWRATVGGGFALWAYKNLVDRGDGRSWAEVFWVEPSVHFTYPGFGWVGPPPEPYLTLLVLAVGAAGVLLALGAFTRVAAVACAAGFTWLFLIDRCTYQNHYYLLCMVVWAATLMPLGATWSVDNLRLKRPARGVPRWCLWLVRFQVGMPYFYGGLAKLNPDWLAGEPMAGMLRENNNIPGTWLDPLTSALPGGPREDLFPSLVAAFTYGGLLLDLLVVPALLWRPTRLPAYALCVLFHLTNATMFHIGVFPWFMIAATLVFFPADWPRRVFAFARAAARPGTSAVRAWAVATPRPVPPTAGVPGPYARRLILGGLAVYAAVQLLAPLRHFAYVGNVNWTEAGHYFSWHMKLRGKSTAVRLTAEFADGTAANVDLRPFVTPWQATRFGRDPEAIRQLAAAVGETPLVVKQDLVVMPDGRPGRRLWCEPATPPDATGTEPRPGTVVGPGAGRAPTAVRGLVLCSYNDRKPQLLIDPTVDLAAVPAAVFGRPDWIMPLVERPRTVEEGPWREPVLLWDRLVETDPAAVRALARLRAAAD